MALVGWPVAVQAQGPMGQGPMGHPMGQGRGWMPTGNETEPWVCMTMGGGNMTEPKTWCMDHAKMHRMMEHMLMMPDPGYDDANETTYPEESVYPENATTYPENVTTYP